MSTSVPWTGRWVHELLSCLISGDAGNITNQLRKARERLEDEENGQDLRTALLKRDAVTTLVHVIVGYSNTLHMLQSREVVTAAGEVLYFMIKQGSKQALLVTKDCGVKQFCAMLKGLAQSGQGTVVVCRIILKLCEVEKPSGLKHVSTVEQLVSSCLRHSKNQTLFSLGLQLLTLLCKSHSGNIEALGKHPQLGDFFQCCKKFWTSKKFCISSMSLFSLLMARSEHPPLVLLRPVMIRALVGAMNEFSVDADVVGKATHILLRVSREKSALDAIIEVKLFDEIYPFVSLHLGREELLAKLCLLLWRCFWLGKVEMEMNQFVRFDRTSTKAEMSDVINTANVQQNVTSSVDLIRENVLEEESLPTGGDHYSLTVSTQDEERPRLLEQTSTNPQLDTLLRIIENLKSRKQTFSMEVFSADLTGQQHKPTTLVSPSDNPSTGQQGSPRFPSKNLRFESRFECGNLSKVFRIGEKEYRCLLHADTNSHGQVQWFYFAVYGMQKKVAYKFTFDNLEKPDSMFNQGMKPVLFCPQTSSVQGVGWTRVGRDICYLMNPFEKAASIGDTGKKSIPCYSATMLVQLPDSFEEPDENKPHFLAYCIPYTYRNLVRDLETFSEGSHCVQQTSLCKTLAGNDCPLLTITDFSPPTTNQQDPETEQVQPSSFGTREDSARKLDCHKAPTWKPFPSLVSESGEEERDKEEGLHDQKQEDFRKKPSLVEIDGQSNGFVPIEDRPIVFFSARVHPGETNASWIMRGLIQFLISEDPLAIELRSRVIFKVVPMLNPDGVIFGNHRCNLAGMDLNRQWTSPSVSESPTIFHCRKILSTAAKQSKLRLFVDIHGHSRKAGIFLYGCEDSKRFGCEELVFPYILSEAADIDVFNLDSCSYRVLKSKASCGRVYVWRDLKVVNSFTLEASMAGNKTHHFTVADYERMGIDIGKSVWDLVNPDQEKVNEIKALLGAKFPNRFLLPMPGMNPPLGSTSVVTAKSFKGQSQKKATRSQPKQNQGTDDICSNSPNKLSAKENSEQERGNKILKKKSKATSTIGVSTASNASARRSTKVPRQRILKRSSLRSKDNNA